MAVYYASKAGVAACTEAVAHEPQRNRGNDQRLLSGSGADRFQRQACMEEAPLVRMLQPISAETCAKAGWEAFKKGEVVAFPRGVDAMGAFFSRGVATPRDLCGARVLPQADAVGVTPLSAAWRLPAEVRLDAMFACNPRAGHYLNVR